MNTTFYKILAHDLRPPLQGGDPLPIDQLPYETETVVLDSGPASCAPGWHCVSDLAAGFRIAGLWPSGRPARVFEVEPSDDVVERDAKFRSSKLTFIRELDHEGIERGVHDLSKPFGRYRRGMVSEQMAWYVALGRPQHDPELVEAGLKKALKVRGLRWDLVWSVDDLVAVPGRRVLESPHNGAMVPEPIDRGRVKAISGDQALIEVESMSHFGVRVHWAYPFDEWQPITDLRPIGGEDR